MPRSIDKLVTILENINSNTIGGIKPEYIASVCREAAQRLRTFHDRYSTEVALRPKRRSVRKSSPAPQRYNYGDGYQIDLEEFIAANREQ